MSLEVRLSIKFAEEYANFPAHDASLIDAFWTHCESYPLSQWMGKVKPSWELPWDFPFRSARVAYAKQYDLWHAHVGYPCWNPSNNFGAHYLTSDYLLHFTYRPGDSFLKLVEYRDHGRPFALPSAEYIFGEL